MSEEIIYLVEVAAYTGSAEETFRFCTGIGFTSLPTDSPANTFYEPRVEHPGLFRQDMFSPGATSGGSSGGYGEITLINTDGGLDAFIDYGFDGRRCVVKQGYQSQSLAEFATVITGTVEQCETSWNRVTLRLKDRSVELDVTLQDAFYAGDNALPAGIEGTSELKDKPKPMLYGKCNNVTPVMVNTSKLIYQISGNALSAVSAVYDNGVVLTAGSTAYTDQADMEANAPAAGEYRVWLAGGCFRLGSSPAGTITADAVQGATAADRTAGQIIKQIVTAKLGSNQIVEQSIITLDTQAPYVVGYYTGHDSVTAKTALDAICASVGAWWGFDNSGLFWSKQLTPPDASQSLMTLTEAEILSLDRTATADSDKGVPIYKVNLDFSKNWTVQTSGLAGSVSDDQLLFEDTDPTQLTEDRRNLLGMEYIRTSATDATVQTKHLLAPEMTVQTTIDSLTDANNEADRLLELRKVRRDRLSVRIPMDAITAPNNGFWDSESIVELPSQLSRYAVASDDEYIYVLGGYPATNKVMRLNITAPASSWDDDGISDMPEARYDFDACVAGGYLYIIAGQGITTVKRLNLLDPTGSWQACRSLPAATYNSRSITYNNHLYCIGGGASNNVYKLDLSDPINNNWAVVTTLPAGSWYFAKLIYGSFLYVSGGYGFDGKASHLSHRIDLDNIAVGWSQVSDLYFGLILHGLVEYEGYVVELGGGRIYPPDYSGGIDAVTAVVGQNPYIPELPKPMLYIEAFKANGDLFLFNGKETYKLIFPSRSDYYEKALSLGRTVNVAYPRYGYTSGRPMKIIGVESDHQSRIINLELWG